MLAYLSALGVQKLYRLSSLDIQILEK